MNERRRKGLEGLPANSTEVISMHTAQAGGADAVGVVFLWLIAAALLVVAVWARSIGVALVMLPVLGGAIWWTAVRVHDRRAARRIARRFGR
jgi:uncharacterized membrane protein